MKINVQIHLTWAKHEWVKVISHRLMYKYIQQSNVPKKYLNKLGEVYYNWLL